MFSGIGGFRAGLERIGGFKCIGHCEADKFANASYNAIFDTEGDYFCDDAREINTADLPDFDLLCAGFPCQAFSVAGHRRGFDDARGTLFFEIAKVVRARRPKYLLLENVPGLLTHDQGRTYSTILDTLWGLGYHVEWQMLNSKDIGYPRPVPQSRKRLFIVGYLDGRCAGEVLPITRKNRSALKQVIGGAQGQRVYDTSGASVTLMGNGGGAGAKCGLYLLNSEPTPISGVQYMQKAQNGKGYKESNAPMFTLTTQDRHGILQHGRIRKLTPKECLRLQGFEDEKIDRILAVTSDSRAYSQAGNAVTANVISAIGAKIKGMDKKIREQGNHGIRADS